jgi:tryptophan synthase alpha chain
MGQREIEERLHHRRSQGQVGLIPYLTVGFPSVAATLEMVPALEEAGADVVELGVPFSDPLADGTTIQRASFHALGQGVTLAGCLELCRQLRREGVRVPLVLMGYYNPILAYGVQRVAQDAGAAGVHGFIVPDLPVDEARPLREACDVHGLSCIPLLAPTSTESAIAQACDSAGGFIYCVSLTGVTGARTSLPSAAPELVARVRRHTTLPVAVGFGISQREQVQAVSAYADAVVVGSALIEAVEEAAPGHEAARAREFLQGLRDTPAPVA